ncbi:MAG: helix-turn-helix domain-containing protein [Rhizobiaceae bacterium]|nr:helix-turn-helix domain-containing protein [Rhizobiaceae bacterium]MCV0405892.1 helix-turn-helix domain-containing protein [Rhizobiaceae bacterium]
MEKLLASIPETGRALSVGRSTVYALISAGKLKTVKVGKRRLVLVDSTNAYVAALRGGD